jgi:tripartite-type tricarboxylate transporter receptor subunit TctC
LAVVLLGCLSVLAVGSASAQDYPKQTITLIVPSDAGSGIDVVARLMNAKLSSVLGQSVVVENVVGAGSTIGAAKAAEAKPDGYTILLINVTHTAAEALYKNLSYNLIDSFDPVVRFASTFYVFATNPKVEAKTFGEFVDYAKAHPGELNYSSAGVGTTTFMATAILNSAAGIELTHIPYQGGGQALASVVAGETDFYAAPYTTAKPFFEDDKLRPLAVSSLKRSAFLPDLPPASDTVPGYDFTSWYGLLLPKGTPADIRDKIRAAVVETLADPAVKKGLDNLAIDTFDEGPEEFGAFLVKDIAAMKKIVKEAGIEPQ